jgi:hypothetical protein
MPLSKGQLERELQETRRELEALRAARVQPPPPPPPPQPTHNIKLAAFWEQQPAAWFAQAEGLFDAAGLLDQRTRFNLVLARLDERLAAHVTELITAPPAERPYTALKSALIERLAGSAASRLQRLLAAEDLGDRRPSELLRNMRQLAGTEVNEGLLRQLWLQRLPATLRAVLTAQAKLPLDELAALGDTIADTAPEQPSVCATSAPAASTSSDMAALTSCVQQLAQQVAALSGRRSNRPRRDDQQQAARPASGQPRSRPAAGSDEWCWYHRTFGSGATKCRDPCTFTSAGNGEGGR